MKILAAFATVLFAASQLSAQAQPAAQPAEAQSTEVKPAAGKTVPVTGAAKKVEKKDDKKPAPEPKIAGTIITRADGTFLGLEAVGGDFKLSFYDKKKKAVAPDVTRATARWPNKRGPGDVRAVLNPSGNSLVGGSKRVDPPFTYIVYLSLLKGEGENSKVVESFAVPFRG